MQLVFFAPSDIQVARVDRQCILYACEGFERVGIGTTLVALKIKLNSSEIEAPNPLGLYRLRVEPKLISIKSLVSQDSPSWWCGINRFVGHLRVALGFFNASRRQRVFFYTKNYFSAFLFTALRKTLMRRMRVVFEAHTVPRNWFHKAVIRSVDGIVANSYALGADLKKLDSLPPIIGTHQGVDLEHYDEIRTSQQEARAKLGLDVTGCLIVYTGKVYWGYREVDLLLEAAKDLRPGTTLMIVGGRADQAEKYRAEIARRGLSNVQIRSFVPPKDVHLYQLAADILVSYYPAGIDLNKYRSPGKLFEYMAAARAIVAADYAALREVLDDSSAVFVPPEAPIELARTFNALASDAERREALGQAAYSRAKEFTWIARARIIKTFLEGLSGPVSPAIDSRTQAETSVSPLR